MVMVAFASGAHATSASPVKKPANFGMELSRPFPISEIVVLGDLGAISSPTRKRNVFNRLKCWRHIMDFRTFACATNVFGTTSKSGEHQRLFPLFGEAALKTCCASFASGKFGFCFRAASRAARPRVS